ncbi:hypothetical protein [Microbacterium sp. 3J1]|uniref:hypothetical protein n=1 Tax=Microbacterium sp. 3J1 TaxID=861269 RepID=UPI000AF7CD3E|nr:hypothetical protein [Microbacterium sp. 3J1]
MTRADTGRASWHGATVVWAPAERPRGFTDGDLAAMGTGQSHRLAELSGARADAFVAGRALIRGLVREVSGRSEVSIDSRCERCGRHHAAPRADGVSLSVSHTEGLVVAAAAPWPASVGVDIEPSSSAARVAELASLFAPAAAPDLAGWTRLEAALKADGRGLDVDLGTVRMLPAPGPDSGPGSRSAPWSVLLPGRASAITAATVAGPVGHTLSVALG